MTIMEQFANPETIHSMSLGDQMIGSTITMIMGIGTTFIVLIIIWIFIAVLGKTLDRTDSKKESKAAESAATGAGPSGDYAKVEAASDDSLVAVIAAAIAAYTGGSPDRLVVRKITRLCGEQTPWGGSGLEERLETRKM